MEFVFHEETLICTHIAFSEDRTNLSPNSRSESPSPRIRDKWANTGEMLNNGDYVDSAHNPQPSQDRRGDVDFAQDTEESYNSLMYFNDGADKLGDEQLKSQDISVSKKENDVLKSAGGLQETKRIPKKKVDVQEEKILLEYLMEGYEKDVRPVKNASQAITVRVGITLTQILNMV